MSSGSCAAAACWRARTVAAIGADQVDTPMHLRRHDWVYLHAGALPAIGSADAAARAWLEGWIARGGPLVVTRQNGADQTSVALGIVLPAALGSGRIACTIAPSAIARQRGPVTVDEAASVLPTAEAQALRQFAAVIAGHATQLGVYGSTAWQFLTAEAYRHAQSDIDVICDVASSAGFAACLAAFADAARLLSRRASTARCASPAAAPWRGASCTTPATAVRRWSSRRASATLRCFRCGRSWPRCDDRLPSAARPGAAGFILTPPRSRWPGTSAGWPCARSTTKRCSIRSPGS